MTNLAQKPNAAELARVIGCHRSYMHRVLDGKRKLKVSQAVKIFREMGLKIGPVAQLTDAEILVLEHMGERLPA